MVTLHCYTLLWLCSILMALNRHNQLIKLLQGSLADSLSSTKLLNETLPLSTSNFVMVLCNQNSSWLRIEDQRAQQHFRCDVSNQRLYVWPSDLPEFSHTNSCWLGWCYLTQPEHIAPVHTSPCLRCQHPLTNSLTHWQNHHFLQILYLDAEGTDGRRLYMRIFRV